MYSNEHFAAALAQLIGGYQCKNARAFMGMKMKNSWTNLLAEWNIYFSSENRNDYIIA